MFFDTKLEKVKKFQNQVTKLTTLVFRKKVSPKSGVRKKLVELTIEMINTIGFLGSNRCFLIPNLKKWKKIQNQGTKLTSLVFHKKSSTPNYHLRENPIVCHQLRENHLRENHASVSSTRKPCTSTTVRISKTKGWAKWNVYGAKIMLLEIFNLKCEVNCWSINISSEWYD